MKRSQNYRDWYQLGRWRKRADFQKREHPLCGLCLAKGLVVRAVIADHVVPHRGNWNEFWLGALQSLCRNCHESGKKFQELRGFRSDIGEDGFPIDPKHPVYRARKGV